MKSLLSIFSLLLVLMISGFAFADNGMNLSAQTPVFNGGSFKGFIKIRPNRELFVNYAAPKPNMPTLVILNGLTYSTVQWDKFVAPLEARGVGLLRYDMYGMGETLQKYGPPIAAITYEEQTDDLKQLLQVMRIRGPYNITGLSYGGGIAIAYATKFPQDIANLILMAPFTQAVEAQDTWIKAQIWATRQMFPYNPASDEQLYDYFLRQIIYGTYPQAEPIVLSRPYLLEGILRMVQGIRSYRPIDHISQLPKNIHLVVAGKDQYIQRPVLDSYWDMVPKPSKASRIYVNDSEHKLPEAVPNFVAAWVYQIIVKKNPLMYQGFDFQGFPHEGEVSYSGGKFKLTVGKE
jgi:pimeloyl-ACP methyl ester carboxylesterase